MNGSRIWYFVIAIFAFSFGMEFAGFLAENIPQAKPLYVLDLGSFVDDTVTLNGAYLGIYGTGMLYAIDGNTIIVTNKNGEGREEIFPEFDTMAILMPFVQPDGSIKITYVLCDYSDPSSCVLDPDDLRFIDYPKEKTPELMPAQPQPVQPPVVHPNL